MDAKEIIDYIGAVKKRTPVKLYVREREPVDYGAATVFGTGGGADRGHGTARADEYGAGTNHGR